MNFGQFIHNLDSNVHDLLRKLENTMKKIKRTYIVGKYFAKKTFHYGSV